jgi:CubicO group peptidase (beta-lactamase class C family)
MKLAVFRIARITAAVLFALPGPLGAAPGPAASIDDLFTRLAAHGFSGAVLVASHGEVLVRKGYGLADRETGAPVTADTVFDVGSITKQFTAAGILRLEMEGKLSTSDRLGLYLPAIAVRDDLGAITLDQLLTHTSGLGNLYLDQFPSWKEYLAEILKRPLAAPPGTAFAYSNTGYDLLGEVIAAVSGVPFERYLRDHLFLPAGLRATGFDLPAWRRDRIARYQDWTTRAWQQPVAMPLDRPQGLRLSGSGGMLSTVDDLYRWHRALLGDRVLSAAAREKLFHPALDSYAYGWRIGTTGRGTRVVYHGGFDTGLGLSAGLYRYLDEDAVVIVLANTNMNRQLNMEIVAAWVESLLFGGRVPFPPPSPPSGSVAAPPLSGLAGRYALPSGGLLEVSARGRQLVLATEDPEAMLLLSFPGASAEPAVEDEQMTRVFRGVDGGDWAPLREALGPGAPFERVRERTAAWWEEQKKALGSFVSVRPVHQIGQEWLGEPELQLFLLVRFERGVRLVRGLRDLAGHYAFNVEQIPERLELTLAPAGGGVGSVWSAWSVRFQTGPRVEFAPGILRIIGRRVVTAVRHPEGD